MADAAPDNVFIDDIILPAVDGYPLAGTLFLARGRKTHAVLINAAAGVSREIYRGFAAYLASRGCAVLTYDYRGIGCSRPAAAAGHKAPSLVGFNATLNDWASRDVTAAVAWMRGRYKDLQLSYVGHAFGGHALGLIPNNADVTRALLIETQTGLWKDIPTPERYRVAARRVLGTALTRLIGYQPGWLGSGEDLPKGVSGQLNRWSQSPDYLFSDTSLPALGNFANFTGALRILTFTDDVWPTAATAARVAKEFSATRPQVIALSPSDLGMASIGHLGFFRSELRDTLWRGMAEWLEAESLSQQAAPAAARA